MALVSRITIGLPQEKGAVVLTLLDSRSSGWLNGFASSPLNLVTCPCEGTWEEDEVAGLAAHGLEFSALTLNFRQ